jgi:hypothetical protein
MCIIDGYHLTTVNASSVLKKAFIISKNADLAISFTFEALGGVPNAMNPKIH